MKFKFAAVAAVAMCALLIGAGPSAANDLTNSASALTVATTYESGFETTQGRGRGGGGGSFRRGGGGGGFVGPRRRNNTGRNVAIGVGALVLGGIVASEVARSRGGNSCSRWNYQCNRGVGSSCRNLDRYC